MCQANNHGWWSIPRLHRPIKSHYCIINACVRWSLLWYPTGNKTYLLFEVGLSMWTIHYIHIMWSTLFECKGLPMDPGTLIMDHKISFILVCMHENVYLTSWKTVLHFGVYDKNKVEEPKNESYYKGNLLCVLCKQSMSKKQESNPKSTKLEFIWQNIANSILEWGTDWDEICENDSNLFEG